MNARRENGVVIRILSLIARVMSVTSCVVYFVGSGVVRGQSTVPMTLYSYQVIWQGLLDDGNFDEETIGGNNYANQFFAGRWNLNLLPDTNYLVNFKGFISTPVWYGAPDCYVVTLSTNPAEVPANGAYTSLVPLGGGFYYLDNLARGPTGTFLLNVKSRVKPTISDIKYMKANYLKADGTSTCTVSLEDPSFAAPPLTWAIQGDPLGCTLAPSADTMTATLTAGMTNGTVTVIGTDSKGCSGSVQVELKCANSADKQNGGLSCDSCSGGGDIGGVDAENGSVDVGVGLGWSTVTGSAGQLAIGEANPGPLLATPQTLHYKYSRPDVQVLYDGSGVLRQVLAPEGLADIVTNSATEYSINFYSPTNVLPETNNLYPFTGSPLSTVTVQSPGGDTNHLQVTRTFEGSPTVFDYYWLTNAWKLVSGDGMRQETKTTVWSATNTIRTVTQIIQDATGHTVKQIVQTYQMFPNGEHLTQQVVGTGADAQTTTYTFLPNGYLQQSVMPNGSWDYYLYDSQNRIINVFSSFLNQSVTTNSSLCRLVVNDYTTNNISGSGDDGSLGPGLPRMTVQYLQGKEIGRSYLVMLPGERDEIRCVTTGAAWNATDNLVTVIKTYTDGPHKDELLSTQHPDGTMEIYLYSDTTPNTTNYVLVGHPDGSGTNIDNGTEAVTVYGPIGQLLSQQVIDIASGYTVSSETYLYDSLKRLTNTVYLDGTTSSQVYDCCTLAETIDRDGTGTYFTSDALKRRITTTRAGVTVSNSLDAAGDILAIYRFGSDGTIITNQTSAYDDSGFMYSSADALLNTTIYTNYVDGSGQTIDETTFPDLSTRIKTNAIDGSLLGKGGTAVHGVRYAYGVEQDGGVYRAYTETIPLTTSNTDSSETTKTYTDMVGRAYKTLFADGASQNTFFNQQGQQSAVVDPDGVTNLYQYDEKGQLEFRAVDMNGNGVIDFTNTDIITQTTNDVVADQGTLVQRTRTFEWGTDGVDSPVLTSTEEQEIGGFRSWNISYGLTNFTQIGYPGNGLRVTTSTLPDGSQIITTNQYGLQLSATSRDSLGVQIGQTTYGYDVFNRQATVNDVRTGTTSYTYTLADQLATVTTPVPATGQSAQVTTSLYDNMGRNYQINLPDTTTVLNTFYTTGELKQTSGSRTYPVQYTYDYAGRVKTMTTWQNFATSGNPATTTWNYDSQRGFLVSKQYNDGNGPVYTSTPAGRLHSRTWVRGVTTTYGYDGAGRMAGATYSDGTPGVSYTYDRRGRSVQINDVGVCNRTYNDAGEVLTDEYGASSLNLSSQLNYFYDALLRPAALTNLSLGSVASYGYDNASRLSSVSDGINTATYTYLTNSPLVGQIQFTRGGTVRLTTTQSYDNLSRLTNVLNSAAANLSSDYGYNQANQRTNQLREDGSYWVYGYDSLGQVTLGVKYWNDGTKVAGQQFGYTFDTIGNRTQTQTGGDSSGGNLRTSSYSANLLNQYTSRTVPGYVDVQGGVNSNAAVLVNGNPAYQKGSYYREELPVTNGSGPVYMTVTNEAGLGTNSVSWMRNVLVAGTPETYGYDADGNLTNDGKWGYAWDAENRLISMQSIPAIANAARQRFDYAYDYMGRRIYQKQSVWDTNTSAYRAITEERYWYDDWNMIGRSDLATGNVQTYVWGVDLSRSLQGAAGVGGLLFLNDTENGSFYYNYDGNGNVLGLVDANDGTLSAQYDYGPFGEVIRSAGSVAKLNPFRFSTKYQDDETGLLYYGYRYYSGSTGRWLSRDPLEEQGGTVTYGFVDDDPINSFDLWGLLEYYLGNTDPTYTPPPTGQVPIQPTIRLRGRWLAADLGATAAVVKYPYAAVLLSYYLNGDGTPLSLSVSDMDAMLAGSPSASAVYNLELTDAKNFAATLADKPDGDYDIDSRTLSQGVFGPSDNMDWFFAVGRYAAWGKGTVHVKNCKVILDFTYEFRKRYQWQVNLGKSVTIPGINLQVTDEQMGELSEAGLAKEYDITGETSVTVDVTDLSQARNSLSSTPAGR